MNTPSTRNLINDYQVAAVADLDRLARRIEKALDMPGTRAPAPSALAA